MGEFAYAPPLVPVYGSYTKLVWKTGVEKRGQLLPQAPFGPPEKAYGNIGSNEPSAAVLVRGGTVMQMPWSVESHVSRVRHHGGSGLFPR